MKHFSLPSMLKTVVLLKMFVETFIQFFQDSLMNRKFKRTPFIINVSLNLMSLSEYEFLNHLILLTPIIWTVLWQFKQTPFISFEQTVKVCWILDQVFFFLYLREWKTWAFEPWHQSANHSPVPTPSHPRHSTYPSTILTTGAPYRPKHRHTQAGKGWGQWGVVRGRVWWTFTPSINQSVGQYFVFSTFRKCTPWKGESLRYFVRDLTYWWFFQLNPYGVLFFFFFRH